MEDRESTDLLGAQRAAFDAGPEGLPARPVRRLVALDEVVEWLRDADPYVAADFERKFGGGER